MSLSSRSIGIKFRNRCAQLGIPPDRMEHDLELVTDVITELRLDIAEDKKMEPGEKSVSIINLSLIERGIQNARRDLAGTKSSFDGITAGNGRSLSMAQFRAQPPSESFTESPPTKPQSKKP